MDGLATAPGLAIGVYVVVDRGTERLLRGLPDLRLTGASRSAGALRSVDELPPDTRALVVSDRVRDSRTCLAEILARWAPRLPVVLHVSDHRRLLDLHAE